MGSGRFADGWNAAWLSRGTSARAALPRAARSAGVSLPTSESSWYLATRRGGASAVSAFIPSTMPRRAARSLTRRG